ncbi:hypothetical protein [Serratia marcescens]|uniref:hypothetical protein n=1 Tax=Serratia marcescens TaxID=615 RepID=UPI003D7760F9
MRKEHSITELMPCSYIDAWMLKRRSEQSSVLALAIGKLAGTGAMDDCEIEILLQIQEHLSDEISEGLKKIMGENDDA